MRGDVMATDKVAVTDLNAELGNLLGATPAREWRVRMPDGELRWVIDDEGAKYWARYWDGEAVLAELPLCYDASRDLMAGVEDEIERRGLAEEYAKELQALATGVRRAPGVRRSAVWTLDLFRIAHAPPDLRARAAWDVLKAGGEIARC